MKLEDWLCRTFKGTLVGKEEINFPCPKCSHPDFFFNFKKKLGYCHRARCHLKVNLEGLKKFAPSKPLPTVTDATLVEVAPDPTPKEIVLPSSAQPLLEMVEGQLVTRYPVVSEQVAGRGVSPQSQYRFNLHWDGSRVYIPVYSGGKLVNYVGRAAWWYDTGLKRYSYATGASTRDYLFNWDEASRYPGLVLVENTFNAMWLGEHCHASTNFGSDLSKTQIDLLHKSKVKSVVFLWDEGAEWAADRARERLMALAIQSVVLRIKGQPDNYDIRDLLPWIEYAHANSKEKAIMVMGDA